MKRFAFALMCAALLWGCEEKAEGGGESPIGPDEEEVIAPKWSNFIHLSDIHLDDTLQGDIEHGEDTGLKLWAATKTKLASILDGPDAPEFVLYTGDLPAHYSCHTTCFLKDGSENEEKHDQDLTAILQDLGDLVKENRIPFLYAPGNNDALDGDYYSFSDAEGNTPFSLVNDEEYAFPALNASKPCGNPPCTVSNPEKAMGYYSARPIPGLKVISLNSIILGRNYFETDGVSQADAGNAQLTWLGQELEDARKVGEKVYITMHIPMGTDAYAVHENIKRKEEGETLKPTWMWSHTPSVKDSWLDEFLGYTEDYQKEIAGVFYGHTHMDEFRRLYNSEGSQITEVAISAPGITPLHYNNPGFKVVHYDAKSMEVMDFETHYTHPNDHTWSSYRFSDFSGCPDAKTFCECVAEMTLPDAGTVMDSIYTVRNGVPGYDVKAGIEVMAGQ